MSLSALCIWFCTNVSCEEACKLACNLCSTNLQDDAGKQQLLSQVLTKQEQVECFLRDRKRSLAVTVQQASLWTPEQPPVATEQLHIKSQDQKHHLPQQLMNNKHASLHVPEGSGYVSVCGVILPSKMTTSLDQAATTGQQLVQTASMVDNLRAAALALSQHRPILLEGPPGMQKPG